MAGRDELVLDDQSGFTIGSFVREVYSRVPATVPGERIASVLDGFQQSYDVPDLDKRLAFFAADILLEDPAGLPRARGRAELEAFFRSTFDNGVRILRKPVERIVVGNEAIERLDMRLEKTGLAPETLPHIAHYVFDDAGLIRQLRVFFDLASIGK
jgi:hypothetical protein